VVFGENQGVMCSIFTTVQMPHIFDIIYNFSAAVSLYCNKTAVFVKNTQKPKIFTAFQTETDTETEFLQNTDRNWTEFFCNVTHLKDEV